MVHKMKNPDFWMISDGKGILNGSNGKYLPITRNFVFPPAKFSISEGQIFIFNSTGTGLALRF